MQIIYFDIDETTDTATERLIKKLKSYRAEIDYIVADEDDSRHEYALATFKDDAMITRALELQKKYKKAKHVIVVGIGGSSLGIEAIDAALKPIDGKKQLHVLDAVSAYRVDELMVELKKVKKAEDVVVCVISKSGGTTETLTNASVLREQLRKQLGAKVDKQFVYIGNNGNSLLKTGKKLGGEVVAMPEIVGGRYSVFTAVGIVPLALLGHDIEALLAGAEDATLEHYEEAVAESAARLVSYMKKGTRTLNFFGFDVRLQKLGFWYRQLLAESIGKEKTRAGEPVNHGVVPVITTPVELHSIGQLYFSGFKGVYTEFVSFEDALHDVAVPKTGSLSSKLKGKSMGDIAAAIYGGVVQAYQERMLPYRSVTFDESLDYSLGLYMSMRMRETMYVAELLDVDAFNQPNVELYKDKTRAILGV